MKAYHRPVTWLAKPAASPRLHPIPMTTASLRYSQKLVLVWPPPPPQLAPTLFLVESKMTKELATKRAALALIIPANGTAK